MGNLTLTQKDLSILNASSDKANVSMWIKHSYPLPLHFLLVYIEWIGGLSDGVVDWPVDSLVLLGGIGL